MRLFDVLGPVMIGPSSSPRRVQRKIGYTAQKLLGDLPAKGRHRLVRQLCHHRQRATAPTAPWWPGLLGLRPDDPRLPDSFALAQQQGMKFRPPVELLRAHPNTAVLTLKPDRAGSFR